MNESLSEEVKIDFRQPPHLIQKQILALPFEQQKKWIDEWLELPEIKKDIERKRQERIIHPKPINMTKQKPDQHWSD